MILNAKSFHNKDKIQRAKIGLQLFLSILIITSIILNVVVIITKSMPLIVVYMFTPAISSILTRIILKEGFKDVSFSLGNLKIWKGIGFALLIPMIICGITYSIAWLSGIARFQHPEGGMLEPIYNMLGLQYVVAPFSFIYLVVLSGIFGSLLSLIPVLGEEMGWRGYMLTRLIDAEFSRPILISGVIWATWHVPIVVAGLYVGGSSVVLSVLGIYLCIVPFSYITAYLRLFTGSIWPSVIIHATWNAIIQGPFARASTGYQTEIWIGESGLITALIILITAIIVSRIIRFTKY
ncbi:CPBP family intramembrane metalloprotease domain-containing protein [Bacillus wiedmannii]|uniref:CPBP family intramembrane glutamic endopeptidase n=1 Tax=Bacillus wiedmannii TaxID=1890302 RepID=UPI000BF936CA|nr:CPBP family intramembrane glutamic endopeptidase [Bacillus wiedmannii]PEP19423.1 CPBP family intramembrane metalloprotease domain-containing protein [Bacillus wiedmannii]PEP92002.1 CPBP family intramembrane metalloprotease domain-containing protein [Bacillus wiedmannii]PFY70596.1 CPBP family intramembrane metalloprotease domain-containing protein [Bacillus wiedmannii]PHF06969.1 CPBP family intramembrane metalloprotease domain-containing protein [Bacillus wiedmannii]PHF97201.1 CPBP family in